MFSFEELHQQFVEINNFILQNRMRSFGPSHPCQIQQSNNSSSIPPYSLIALQFIPCHMPINSYFVILLLTYNKG